MIKLIARWYYSFLLLDDKFLEIELKWTNKLSWIGMFMSGVWIQLIQKSASTSFVQSGYHETVHVETDCDRVLNFCKWHVLCYVVCL